jgi:trehalose-phosphatase
MRPLNPNFSVESFWQSLKKNNESFLFLDYDGTLSPFTADRNNAVPYEGVKDRLSVLIKSTTTNLIIISGRDIKTLKRLLDLESLPEIWGCHGAERFSEDKGYQIFLDKEFLRGLKFVKDWTSQNNLSKYAEFKPAGCAFHWRDLQEKTAKAIINRVQSYWESKLDDFGMILHLFDGGIEIRPKNIDKGTAVTEIINNIDECLPLAYLGDDKTDEDAFKAIGTRGLKILVNKKERQSLADIQINPPKEMLDFLDKWLQFSAKLSG